MKNGRLTRNVALVSGAGLAAVPMAFVATPSLAAADCGEGTEVAAGICEKAFTTAGDYTFAVPASVAKMSAVLVGGGQSGAVQGFGPGEFWLYAGSGGGVLFVDSVDLSAPIALTVGAAGPLNWSSSAGDTIVGSNVAGGAGVYESVPQSGLPQAFPAFGAVDGPLLYVISGAGAGGTPSSCAGGPGVTASSVAAGSSLFPAVAGEPELGQGGNCSGVTLTSEAGPGRGGDVYDELPNYEGSAGSDGAVIFRWTPGLPDTGMNVQPWVIGAGVADVAGGALFSSGVLLTRRQGRHSA
jgi:hypothetical protein